MAESMDFERQLRELRAWMETLVSILVANGTLSEGHRRLFDKVTEKASHAPSNQVRLKTIDKYQVESSNIDCAGLMHLCGGRCCSFDITMSIQDLEEGELQWEWERPYVLKHDKTDGYCYKMDRETGGCTCYDARPATCRQYECTQDRRVWLDWENRVPAPLPNTVKVALPRYVGDRGETE